jgi:hypothetical protein
MRGSRLGACDEHKDVIGGANPQDCSTLFGFMDAMSMWFWNLLELITPVRLIQHVIQLNVLTIKLMREILIIWGCSRQ